MNSMLPTQESARSPYELTAEDKGCFTHLSSEHYLILWVLTLQRRTRGKLLPITPWHAMNLSGNTIGRRCEEVLPWAPI
jgi:hypothetical protein